MTTKISDKLREAALEYHRHPTPGKIKVMPTKALTTQQDLSLAYSPGVAAACEVIVDDPNEASRVTSRGNLVAVISNGTAVLGLGDIGPLAAKPVMEGKGVLFKKFADIDVFDIEIEEHDPDKLIEIIASLEPTFGGLNLEDIKAPECFYIEEQLKKRLNIPVFHDDQHGTAIIATAALLNALRITNQNIKDIRMVASGAGAAGIACLDLMVKLGLKKKNVLVCDSQGVIHSGRTEHVEGNKLSYARDTELRTLEQAMVGADAFLGVSVGGVVSQDMVRSMAEQPIIMALANPIPEIMPAEAKAARPDAIVATGRSDFPNQVNNVLCFPYLFRGALDVGATVINAKMKLACVKALARLARIEVDDVTAKAYGNRRLQFGPEYLIPKPFDSRLLAELAPAVAKAAMKTGVATRPLEDLDAYKEHLTQFVFRTGLLMKPVFDSARMDPKRVVFAEGEEEVVLRAMQTVLEENLAIPILIGRPAVIADRIKRLGLRIRPGEDFELVNPESDPRFKDYWTLYHDIMQRRGISPDIAKAIVRTRPSVIAALMVERDEADALITGVVGRYYKKLRYVLDVIGLHRDSSIVASLGVMTANHGAYFVCDTHVNENPSAEEIAEITLMAAEKIRLFGIVPRVALLSHSAFGSHESDSAAKMRHALQLIVKRDPNLQIEGEMTADMALDEVLRARVFPNARMSGNANLLVMPNLDSAHIAFNLARVIADGVTVGPILMGTAKPIHVLTASATARRLVNMTAFAVVDAQQAEKQRELFNGESHRPVAAPEEADE